MCIRDSSYLELNARANRLAHHLRRAGVAPDDRVAIYVQRGVGMVIGLMATLKAGAAYVPLDPAYPVDRLAYTLQDSAPTVLLTQSGMEHGWRELLEGATTTMRVLDVVADSAQWADEADTDLAYADTGVTQANLAYVPVSYTHLDVYKRQASPRSHPDCLRSRWPRRRGWVRASSAT